MTSLRLLQALRLPRPLQLAPGARVRRVPSTQMQMRGAAATAAAGAAAAAHVAAAPHAPHAPHAALCGFGRPSCWCWRLIPARSVGFCGAARRLFTARARHASLSIGLLARCTTALAFINWAALAPPLSSIRASPTSFSPPQRRRCLTSWPRTASGRRALTYVL